MPDELTFELRATPVPTEPVRLKSTWTIQHSNYTLFIDGTEVGPEGCYRHYLVDRRTPGRSREVTALLLKLGQRP